MQTERHAIEELVKLQGLLHRAITAFASGAILQANKYLPGTRKNSLHPAWKEQFDRLEVLSGAAVHGAAVKQGGCAYRNAAILLAYGYRTLDTWIQQQEFEPCCIKPVCRRQLQDAGGLRGNQGVLGSYRDYWAPDFGEVLAGAYVHGSYSTEDNNAYSDLDTLLVLRRSVAIDGEGLYRFGRRAMKSLRYLLQADLLQHHGNFVLTEIDFDFYCDAYFPNVLFEQSTSLFQAETLTIRYTRDSREEACAHLRGMCQRFTGDWEHKHLTTAYHLKLQLSCFMILPAVLLEVLGRPCYKRESFMQVKSLFPPDIWSIMDEVSELRNRWRQVDGLVFRNFAWFQPYLWSQVVSMGGRCSVPPEIWNAVQQREFRRRTGEFASYCMSLSSMEEQA